MKCTCVYEKTFFAKPLPHRVYSEPSLPLDPCGRYRKINMRKIKGNKHQIVKSIGFSVRSQSIKSIFFTVYQLLPTYFPPVVVRGWRGEGMIVVIAVMFQYIVPYTLYRVLGLDVDDRSVCYIKYDIENTVNGLGRKGTGVRGTYCTRTSFTDTEKVN